MEKCECCKVSDAKIKIAVSRVDTGEEIDWAVFCTECMYFLTRANQDIGSFLSERAIMMAIE